MPSGSGCSGTTKVGVVCDLSRPPGLATGLLARPAPRAAFGGDRGAGARTPREEGQGRLSSTPPPALGGGGSPPSLMKFISSTPCPLHREEGIRFGVGGWGEGVGRTTAPTPPPWTAARPAWQAPAGRGAASCSLLPLCARRPWGERHGPTPGLTSSQLQRAPWVLEGGQGGASDTRIGLWAPGSPPSAAQGRRYWRPPRL